MRLYNILILLCISACSSSDISNSRYVENATMADITKTETLLRQLPPPQRTVPISVYSYRDATGQNKESENGNSFSKAVTQGADQILIQALKAAGNGKWFKVIERGGIENIIRERKLIRLMADNAQLPPLAFSGILIEGGITSYESNIVSGGAGARYLGIGGNTDYRRDVVTVHLRAVSVNTGEVVVSTSSSKTIYSSLARVGMFKYVGLEKLLELEAGAAINEPPQFAARQAIEMAVYSLVSEGAQLGIWKFKTFEMQKQSIAAYRAIKSGKLDVDDVIIENNEKDIPKEITSSNKQVSKEDVAVEKIIHASHLYHPEHHIQHRLRIRGDSQRVEHYIQSPPEDLSRRIPQSAYRKRSSFSQRKNSF